MCGNINNEYETEEKYVNITLNPDKSRRLNICFNNVAECGKEFQLI
jgi:hypothetical protein